MGAVRAKGEKKEGMVDQEDDTYLGMTLHYQQYNPSPFQPHHKERF